MRASGRGHLDRGRLRKPVEAQLQRRPAAVDLESHLFPGADIKLRKQVGPGFVPSDHIGDELTVVEDHPAVQQLDLAAAIVRIGAVRGLDRDAPRKQEEPAEANRRDRGQDNDDPTRGGHSGT